MTRPTNFPDWATSGANVLEPSSGKKVAGFLSGEQAPAQFFNWLHGVAGQWLRYLDDERVLTNDRMTAAEVITEHVQLTGDGDVEYVTSVERNRVVSPINALPLGAAWTIAAHTWSCNTSNSSIYIPLQLPVGAHLRRIRVSVHKGHADEDIGFFLLRYGPYHFSLAPFSAPSPDQIITGTLIGPAGERIFAFEEAGSEADTLDERDDPDDSAKAIVTDNFVYTLQVFTGSVKTVADKIYGVQVIFTDPGPGGR